MCQVDRLALFVSGLIPGVRTWCFREEMHTLADLNLPIDVGQEVICGYSGDTRTRIFSCSGPPLEGEDPIVS